MTRETDSKTLALVPDWPASLDTQSRIETAIGRRDFQATMTQGLLRSQPVNLSPLERF